SGFFFQAEDGIRDFHVTGVQTCALPISLLNNFNYKQDIYAAYTSYTGEIGKFGYQAGLRLEYATYEGSTLALSGQKYFNDFLNRSEERRVGKACRSRWATG